MRLPAALVALLALATVCLPAQRRESLDIYFIDVEGGQATLFISPSGESMLMDAGNPGPDDRDPNRILAVAKAAGLSQIDYMVASHHHSDHIGGVAAIAARMPVRHFLDYGAMIEPGERGRQIYDTYVEARKKGTHVEVRPGDKVPIADLEVLVVTAGGAAIDVGRTSARTNPLCREVERRADDPTENARSVGLLVTYGRFRMVDLGDLTYNKELELACPSNRLGTVDVYLTTHHGLNLSGAKPLVHALRPRVAVMNNAGRKGASREAWSTVKSSPGLEDLWQLHYSVARPGLPAFSEAGEQGGPSLNTNESLIANLDDTTAHYLKLAAQADGSFIVTNARTGQSKSYKKRN